LQKTVLKLGADELQRIRNVVEDKQICLVVDETTLSGTQYLHILVGTLEMPHIRYLYDCQLRHDHQMVTVLFKQLDMLLDLLESTETPSVFYCMMLQDIWWPQAMY